MTAKEKIDEYISTTNDWRGNLIKEIRKLILESNPGIQEEWKWSSPVWSCNGMVCSASAFKNHVGLNFFNGAMLEDPDGFFNSGMDSKKSRSVNFQKDDTVNKNALKTLLSKAISYNKNH